MYKSVLCLWHSYKVFFIISYLRYENKCYEFTIYCTRHTNTSNKECWTKCFKKMSVKEEVFDQGIYHNLEDGEQTLPMNSTWWVFCTHQFHFTVWALQLHNAKHTSPTSAKKHNTILSLMRQSRKHVCLQSNLHSFVDVTALSFNLCIQE